MDKKIVYRDSENIFNEAFIEWSAIRNSPPLVQIKMQGKDFQIIIQEEDYFAALQTLRKELEKKEFFLYCNGASKNVYPSAMMRDMGEGLKAYRLEIGESASKDNIVDIFEYNAEKFISCTVKEQDLFFSNWQKSKKITSYLELNTLKYDLETIRNIRKDFLFFWGHHQKEIRIIDKSCLSQWYPCQFIKNKIRYFSTEQWMMAEKARLFKDNEILEKILTSDSPREAKKLGRKIKGFGQDLWDSRKCSIVKKGNFLKFTQDSCLKEFLLSTSDSIIAEASPYDLIWGIGMQQNEIGVDNIENWRGQNLLGFILMEIRDKIKENNL